MTTIETDRDEVTEPAAHTPEDDASKHAAGPVSRLETGTVVRRVARSYLLPVLASILIALGANLIVAGTTAALPHLINQTVQLVFVEKQQEMMLLIPAAALVIQLLKALATYVSNVQMNYVGQKLVSTVQNQLFSRLMLADLAWVQARHSGQFISTFMTDVIRLRDGSAQTIINLSRHLPTLVALIGYMYYLDWLMAVLATGVIPIAAVFMRKLGKRTRKATSLGLEETGSLSTLIAETLRGIRVVKAYGQEDHEIGRAGVTINNVLTHMMESVRAKAAASPITEALTGVGIAAVIYYASMQAMSGNMDAGDFFGFMAAVMLAYQPLKAVANQQTILQEGVAAASRIFPLLDVQAKIGDLPDATTLNVRDGAIRFRDVSFHYDDGTKALSNINIDVPAGETIALVGPSGAGKSTLLNLVPRFYDISSGSVEIDGQDIRHVTLESLRQASGLVTQDPFLFDDTVRANIAYGSPDATDEEIEAAARNAAAHEFIRVLPDGYNTRVGESGLKLSGGQRQRIAIARAMLKNAPILLLDEATSALDTASELQVQNALQKLMKGRTTLVIAHRLSTIMHADRIYVIDDGRVLEEGRHDELVAQDGLYAELSRSQFSQSNDNAAIAAGK